MWTRERISVCAYFGILGLVCASWTASIDDLKLLLGLTQDELGWLLFSGPVGNLVSFACAGALCSRLGSRGAVRLATSGYLVATGLLATCFFLKAPIPVWCVTLAVFACCGSLVNISVNAQAGLVEKRAGRQIMSSFHAVFSVACLLSGLLALVLTTAAVPVGPRLAFTLIAAVAAHLFFSRGLVADAPAPQEDAARRRTWHRPDRALIALGAAALIIMGCEGAVSDWVGVFFRESLAVPPSRVKWGFCAVVGLMSVGRFVSDGLVNRFSAARVFHVDCVLVSCGLALALCVPFLPLTGLAAHLTATLGYAVTGFGISALVPILYSKVNRTKAMPPASALTFVGTMGFLGYFMGPPMIGCLAKLFSLSAALGLFALLILLCLFINPDRSSDGASR